MGPALADFYESAAFRNGGWDYFPPFDYAGKFG